jgi:acetyltransferase
VFGPVVLFGQGGTAVEVVRDRAVALPPLNTALADDLIARTRVSKLLAGYRNRPPADREAIARSLIGLSRLMIDIPEIAELDINPLLADDEGVLALDARIRLAPPSAAGADRLAIRPYPHELEEEVYFGGRPLTVRPIRPEDEPQHRALFERLKPEDIRFRFFGAMRTPTHETLARFTQIDYDREMAFIATRADDAGTPETLGVVRAVTDPDNLEADFSIVVRSDVKGQGLGTRLLGKIIDYCRARGTQRLVGQILRDNAAMTALARDRGFTFSAGVTPEMSTVGLELTPVQP